MPGADPQSAGSAAQRRMRDSKGLVPHKGRWSSVGAKAALAAGTALALADPAFSQSASPRGELGTFEVIQLAMFMGITGAAMLSALWLIRERGRTAAENIKLRERVADLTASLRRSDAIANLRDQRILVWFADGKKAELAGALGADAGAPEDRATFLAFGRWLSPQSAAALEGAITELRERRRDFDLIVETRKATLLEVQGRHAVSHVAVRFSSMSQARQEHAELKFEHQQTRAEQEAMRGLLDALKMPFWLRSPDGRLVWVNRAYAEAVEAASPQVAVAEARELLGSQARDLIQRGHLASSVFGQEMSTVVRGDRKVYAVTDFACGEGTAGIACDVSEIATIREEFERTLRSHSDTLDQLNTAVASFDADQKLRFFNQAFQKLWELDTPFLESAPDHALLLDRLRSDGKLAEQPEWRRWKETLLSAYYAVEPHQHLWHLPDGRTLRVVGNPQAKGGVTWVFENLTEKISLESRYNTAVRVQGETLDNLAEGVAVFGPDGRVRLSNPAFANLWGLSEGLVKPGTHISLIRAACQELTRSSPWPDLAAIVTGFDETRENRQGMVELADGNVLRYAVIHLPNGQVMTTFVDMTDTVNVERALKDKNEALQRADQLKNDFVQHVSYELRSPLTNIIGFTELLAHGTPGPLNPQQREYVEHIGTSSSVLLTIVNDILDLATVDAGIMELEIHEVPIERTVHSAAELIAERLADDRIRLDIDLAAAPASFHADENRLRQILSNLLANAANHAPEGSAILLRCAMVGQGIEFTVHDDGPGIADDVREAIFRRFEPRSNGGRRRGAGLGLSIVKSFVELHGGMVEIQSAPSHGTTVICRFPLTPDGLRQAAE
jgi:signal transduction histidine kinase